MSVFLNFNYILYTGKLHVMKSFENMKRNNPNPSKSVTLFSVSVTGHYMYIHIFFKIYSQINK